MPFRRWFTGARKHAGVYLLELFIIVAGITLSFWVEEWREDREKAAKTRKALDLMARELAAEIELLDEFITDEDFVWRIHQAYWWHQIKQEPIPFDSAYVYFDAFDFYYPIIDKRVAYSQMLTTGLFDELADDSLAILADAYYKYVKQDVAEFRSFVNRLFDKVEDYHAAQPYDNYHYQTQRIEALDSLRFRSTRIRVHPDSQAKYWAIVSNPKLASLYNVIVTDRGFYRGHLYRQRLEAHRLKDRIERYLAARH